MDLSQKQEVKLHNSKIPKTFNKHNDHRYKQVATLNLPLFHYCTLLRIPHT